MNKLIELVHYPNLSDWKESCEKVLDGLFGSPNGRYLAKAKNVYKLRAPLMSSEKGVSFAALIHPSNPDSGPYGGMSFVLFPIEDAPCLITMIIGTQGLSPDEQVLGRPGHARKAAAISNWLNHKYGDGKMVAWSKQDPVRTEIKVPKNIEQYFSKYSSVFSRYGKELYAIYAPTDNKQGTEDALKAFLDLMFEERNQYPLAAYREDADRIQKEYYSYLMPDITKEGMNQLIKDRRFVIVEGPPGTGKTRMALQLIEEDYGGNGKSIQFHPNTTYENFVGGLAPIETEDEMGFKFAPKKGFLMEAVEDARRDPDKDFLLHVDEINRADLSKVLGEAIFLFEIDEEDKRQIHLSYDFKAGFGTKLSLPDNLYVLGTMNSADRSIAILDVAIRRRFAFQKLWPQMTVVQEYGCEIMQQAFKELVSIFIEHANDDSLSLVPGHSYFLAKDEKKAVKYLKVHLIPLLEEYLMQGYVASFSDAVRGYIQWVNALG